MYFDEHKSQAMLTMKSLKHSPCSLFYFSVLHRLSGLYKIYSFITETEPANLVGVVTCLAAWLCEKQVHTYTYIYMYLAGIIHIPAKYMYMDFLPSFIQSWKMSMYIGHLKTNCFNNSFCLQSFKFTASCIMIALPRKWLQLTI